MSTATAASAKGPIQSVQSTASSAAAPAAKADENLNGDAGGGGNPEDKTAEQLEAERIAAEGKDKGPVVDEVAMKAYFKEQGIEWDGNIEDLKSKLKPAAAAQTAEEIEAQKKVHDKRLLDLYVSKGGTVESFVAMKEIMVADVTDISRKALHNQLIEAGQTEENAKVIAKQMFLEHDLENIERLQDEGDTQFEERKKELEKQIGAEAKILANLGLPVIQKAKSTYEGLENAIKELDAEKAEEAELSKTIDAQIAAFPKQLTIVLGKLNEKDEKDADPVTVTVDQTIVSEVAAILKDKVQRDAIFYKADGNLNVENLMEMMIRNKALESAAKSSLIEGQTRQIKIFKAQFPDRTPGGLGVGGGAAKDGIVKGKVAQKGEVQRTN